MRRFARQVRNRTPGVAPVLFVWDLGGAGGSMFI
jgi:hypothetical protein